MNLNQAMQVMVSTHIAALMANDRANALELKSGPGVGKSSTVIDVCLALARELNEPVGLTTRMLATISSVDVCGFMMPARNPNGGLDTIFSTPPWYPTRANMLVFTPDGVIHPKSTWDGPVPRVGVCFLDEFSQAEDDVKKAAAELILHGEVGDTCLPMGWRVIAASNRMSDRAGVVRSLTFITNRRMEISIDADLPTWNAWVNSLPEAKRPHHLTISFANRSPDLVFRDSVPPGDEPFCTPRTLVLMDRDLRALRTREDVAGDRLPMDGVARQVCAGWIGGGESAQYFTHIKFADELPDIEDIVRDPMRAKLPKERSGQMVCAFFLAAHVSKSNAEKLLTYVERMNVEMQVLAVRTITKQQEKAKWVAEHQRFTDWLLKNQQILMASKA